MRYSNRNIRRALERLAKRKNTLTKKISSDVDFLFDMHTELYGRGKITSDFNPKKPLKTVKDMAERRAKGMVNFRSQFWKDDKIIKYAASLFNLAQEKAARMSMRR